MRLSLAEWFDPALIKFKISPHHDLPSVKGGDWDLRRRYPISEAVKHRSITQRYAEGLRWEDTDLFRTAYAERIQREPIRGEATMKGLLAQYYGRVDQMFESLKRNGFQEGARLPKLLIGRDGEIFIGNQGNHRLAMANVLKLKRIAGEIICRHSMA
jgi:hypothetical protein